MAAHGAEVHPLCRKRAHDWRFGRHTAGTIYSQPYANVGPMALSVRFVEQSNNFGISSYNHVPMPERMLKFRPVRHIDEVWWSEGDALAVNNERLVQNVIAIRN